MFENFDLRAEEHSLVVTARNALLLSSILSVSVANSISKNPEDPFTLINLPGFIYYGKLWTYQRRGHLQRRTFTAVDILQSGHSKMDIFDVAHPKVDILARGRFLRGHCVW